MTGRTFYRVRYLPLIALAIFVCCNVPLKEYNLTGMVIDESSLQGLDSVTVQWVVYLSDETGTAGTSWEDTALTDQNGRYTGVILAKGDGGCRDNAVDITSPQENRPYLFRFSRTGYFTVDVIYESRWLDKVDGDLQQLRVPGVRLARRPGE